MLSSETTGIPSTARMMSPPRASCWPLIVAILSPPINPMFHAVEPSATVLTRNPAGARTLRRAARSPVRMRPWMALQNTLALDKQLLRRADRHDKAEALAATGFCNVLTDDADDLSRHVEQGTTRIARVDGGRGLKELCEGHVAKNGVGWPACADPADAHRVSQPVRSTDDHNLLAHPHLAVVTNSRDPHRRCHPLELQERNV